MKANSKALLLAALSAAVLACEARTDKTDGGGVLLSISDVGEAPATVSVSEATDAGGVTLSGVVIQSVAKDPAGDISALMDVEIESYEVTYGRADTGTRLPPALVRGVFGVVPVGGTREYGELPILTLSQLSTVPLQELARRGSDSETGSELIVLNLTLRFFGRTLSGDPVQTAPANLTIDFRP
ncbi:MAG: hypothetical protein ACRD2Z_10755 [Thermoanaerobaculia bacterium]